MDEVDRTYFNNIREALSRGNTSRLAELCGMSEYEASDYISRYRRIYESMMGKIRASVDTSAEVEQEYDILFEICEKHPLSGNTINRHNFY